ncbi:MAG TPA: hypothetical protein VJT31_35745 [Rugosimonospora sp.]|nr:hypothetical protein [Rugosimonospora sp.]
MSAPVPVRPVPGRPGGTARPPPPRYRAAVPGGAGRLAGTGTAHLRPVPHGADRVTGTGHPNPTTGGQPMPRSAAEQPRRYEARQAARRLRMAERMAKATTPGRRLGVATDHLRAALSHLPDVNAEQIAGEVLAVLATAVERAYREEARLS